MSSTNVPAEKLLQQAQLLKWAAHNKLAQNPGFDYMALVPPVVLGAGGAGAGALALSLADKEQRKYAIRNALIGLVAGAAGGGAAGLARMLLFNR